MKIFAKILLLIGIILLWILPIVLVPFVTVLPYLFSSTFAERLAFSFALTGALLGCGLLSSSNSHRQLFLSGFLKKKDAVPTIGGILLFTFVTALLSANILGSLVNAFEIRPTSMVLQVVEVNESLRKFPRVELKLSCIQTDERFELVLADTLFSHPAIKPGEKITLHGRTNFFGTYVHWIEINAVAKFSC